MDDGCCNFQKESNEHATPKCHLGKGNTCNVDENIDD